MRYRPASGLVLAAALCVGMGCTSAASSTRGPAPDRTVLTREQLRATNYTNVYDAIQALRSNWLNTHGTDSFVAPTQIVVYVDNVKLGGIETLQSVELISVQYIKRYDPQEASARWGLGHGEGVIFISTHPPTDADPRSGPPE